MIMRIFNKIIAAIYVCVVISCVADISETDKIGVFCADEEGRVEVDFNLSGNAIKVVDFKSSLLDGAENVQSGATIYAYIVRDGRTELDNYLVLSGDEVTAPEHSASATSPKMQLVNGATYDFYVVGNAWYIDKSTGLTKDWASVMGQDMPVNYAGGLSDAVYRFDGSDFRSGCRHETLAEVKTYGLPYSGSKRGVQITQDGQDVAIDNCRYLFAKVSFTVDHTGLDGNLNDNYFKNQKVYLKQANPVILPFAEKNVLTGGSISADCDEAMTNGHCETYTLYVPENCKGDLLSTTDPALKSGDNPALASAKDGLTYIEFQGTVNPSNAYAAQIGYSGNVTYRFYLGADNCRNFDVIGGKDYKVTMGFTVDNLFNPSPLWRVETDSFSDGRVIDVMKDAAFADPLGATFVAVRKNRGNTVYLYVNKEGSTGGTNAILGKSLVSDPASYSAADLTDCAVHISPSAATLLADYGISASYDKTTSALAFSVGNAAKFDAFRTGAGQVDVTATLLPSKEGTKTRTFTVKALEDMEVVLPSGDLYIGQKTSVTAKGFCGTPKLSSSVGTVFRTTNVAGDDNYLGSTPVSFTDGKIDLYAYNYNGGTAFDLTLVSDDAFNDGTTTRSFSVKKPKLGLDESEIDLGVDGTERELGVRYYHENGTTPFTTDAFDAAVYAQVLAPVFSTREEDKREYVGYEGMNVYLCKMPSNKTDVRTLFATLDVRGANATLFSKPTVGAESTEVYYRYPKWISGFSDILSDVFNLDTEEAVANRKLETTARLDLAFCQSPFNNLSGAASWYNVNIGDDYSTLSGSVNKDDGKLHVFVTEYSGTEVTVHWYVVPQVNTQTRGIESPWGRRKISALFINKHSSEFAIYPMESFDIKYNPVVLNKLCVYPVNDEQKKYSDADCYICCNLAAMLYTPGRQAPVTFNNFTSLPIGGHQYTDNHYTDNTITENSSGHAYIYLRYVVWSLRNWSGNLFGVQPTPSDYKIGEIYWYDAMVDEAIRTGAGQLTDCYFYYMGGAHESTLRAESYPGSESEQEQMKTYLPVQIGDPRTVRAVKY